MAFRKNRSLAAVNNVKSYSSKDEALKKSEANLRTLIDTASTSYILFDDNLCILSFNLLAQKYSEEINNISLITGTHISNYFSTERWQEVLTMLEKADAGESVSYELNFINPTGIEKWHEIRWVKVTTTD